MINAIYAFFEEFAARRCARRGWHDWRVTVQYDEERSIKEQKLVVVAVYRICNECGQIQSEGQAPHP